MDAQEHRHARDRAEMSRQLAEMKDMLMAFQTSMQPPGPSLSANARGKLPENTTSNLPVRPRTQQRDVPIYSVEDPEVHGPSLSPPRHSIQLTAEFPEYDPYWKSKLGHPKELDYGVEPTWTTWKISMEHKFEEDAPLFRSENSRIRYLFSRTLGDANQLLEPYMEDDYPAPFTSVKDMYTALSELFTNPGETEEAKESFRDLQMERTQPFYEFKSQFLRLASKAEVPRSSFVDELYNRLTEKLKDALAPDKHKWGINFAVASLEIQQTDTRFTLNAKQKQRARTTAVSRTTSSSTAMTTSGPSGTLWKPATYLTGRTGTLTGPPQATPRPRTMSPTDRPNLMPAKSTEGRKYTSRPVTDSSNVKCYNCGKSGHIATYCDEPVQRGSIQEITEEEHFSDEEEEVEDPSGKEHA